MRYAGPGAEGLYGGKDLNSSNHCDHILSDFWSAVTTPGAEQ